MTNWKITGFLATLIIVLVPPVYLVKQRHRQAPVAQLTKSAFVGAGKCVECHRAEYDRWRHSHHDKAMAPASDETVLGDFNDAVFEHFGLVSRFYRNGEGFFVRTQGAGGKTEDFEITHTFGVYPLQQYLIPFPGGRLQCLPIAWDVEKKRWYYLYPPGPQPDSPTDSPPNSPTGAPPDPEDWLYWTNAGQNWNGMCAECHSTNLKKGYDPNTDTYQTTWSEINVSCEACHGPGSRHVEWANIPEMARPETHGGYELEVKTSGITSRGQLDLCAPCHSRRMSLRDNPHDMEALMDYAIPQTLREGLYFSDGQILEEVYVYGSFVQSKMYDRDVRCSDCHDVHSLKRVKPENALCLQCHKADIYDTKNHHFHKQTGESGEPIRSADGDILHAVGTGAQCEQCHMPGRYYMGIDYRPDHSFRVPRPDLSITLGTPNACNRCHVDKSNRWAVEHIAKWYGVKSKPHYGTILDAGRKRLPGAQKELIRLADDRLYPTIVRAEALSLLQSYPTTQSLEAYERALADEEAWMRLVAIRHLIPLDTPDRIRLVSPLLYDPVTSVRIEAARSLTEVPFEQLGTEIQPVFRKALIEYQNAMAYTADFAASRHNLGILYANLGNLEAAEASYKEAIRIDHRFYPAKVNLAMLYNRMGRNPDAERLLRDVVESDPDLYEIHYSLGLLLAEDKRYEDAAVHLAAAAGGMAHRPRVHYNLGLLLARLKRDAEAEDALLRAVEITPDNMDFLYAVADFYMKREQLGKARIIAQRMVDTHPTNSLGHQLLNFIDARLK